MCLYYIKSVYIVICVFGSYNKVHIKWYVLQKYLLYEGDLRSVNQVP